MHFNIYVIICLPSICSDPEIIQLSDGILQPKKDSDISMLASLQVVSQPHNNGGGWAISAFALGRLSHAVAHLLVPPHPTHPKLSCLNVIQGTLQEKRFSWRIGKEISSCSKKCSFNVFNKKWSSFSNWCCGRGIALVSASRLIHPLSSR